MQNFEIGWVPQGWTRGQELRIERGKFVGLVLPVPAQEEQGCCYAVPFDQVEDDARLRAWLAWWRAGR